MSRVARRYAKALFAIAREDSQVEPVGEQIAAAAEVFAFPDIARVAANPLLSEQNRRALADTVVQQLDLPPLLSRFLRLLADRARLGELSSVADHYRKLEDDALNRARLRVCSATELEQQQQRRITEAFGKALGRTIVPQMEVAPALLGGVVVEVEGKVYDGSVRTQLERLARQIARSESHS